VKKLENNHKDKYPDFVKYTGVGFQIVATVGIGVLVGYWLDKKIPNKYSIFTISLSLIMIIVAMIQIYRTFLK